MVHPILVSYLHDTMHGGPVLNFNFIPFYTNIVHRVVHVYASVLCTQPHGWLTFEVHRIRGVHSVRDAIVTGVLVVILFTRRAVWQNNMSTYTGTIVALPTSYVKCWFKDCISLVDIKAAHIILLCTISIPHNIYFYFFILLTTLYVKK